MWYTWIKFLWWDNKIILNPGGRMCVGVDRDVWRHRQCSHWSCSWPEVGGHCGHPATQQVYPDTGTANDHSQGGQCLRLQRYLTIKHEGSVHWFFGLKHTLPIWFPLFLSILLLFLLKFAPIFSDIINSDGSFQLWQKSGWESCEYKTSVSFAAKSQPHIQVTESAYVITCHLCCSSFPCPLMACLWKCTSQFCDQLSTFLSINIYVCLSHQFSNQNCLTWLA